MVASEEGQREPPPWGEVAQRSARRDEGLVSLAGFVPPVVYKGFVGGQAAAESAEHGRSTVRHGPGRREAAS